MSTAASPHAVAIRPIRRAAFWAALLVWITAAWFQNTRPGWNVNSQLALALAIGERGTFRIDDYVRLPGLETGDLAAYDGHYYTDKSPVTPMLAAPFVWLHRQVTDALGMAPSLARVRWLATVAVVGLAAAVLAALLVLELARRGASAAWAARAAVLWVAATPLMGYSILFFNYLPACALLMAAFVMARPLWRDGTVHGLRIFLAGVCGGLAAWTLNTVALPVALLTVPIVASAGLPGERARRIALWVFGGIVGASGYFIHNYAIFGSFAPAYAYEVDPFFREQMARGLMGAGLPRWRVVLLVTLHPFQGLLLWFPIVALALAGCVRQMRGVRAERFEVGVALASFVLLLLYVGGYFMWWGGWSYAPRHLIPALPFLTVGLTPWLRGRGAARAVLLAVGALGTIVNLSAIAVDPQVPPGLPQEALMAPETVEQWPVPMLVLLRHFWIDGYADTNLGTQMGLVGPWSLVPLALIWGAMWCVLPRWVSDAPGGDR